MVHQPTGHANHPGHRSAVALFLCVFMFHFISGSLHAQDWKSRYRQLDVQKYTLSIRVSDTSDIIYGTTQIDLLFKQPGDRFILDFAGEGDASGMQVDSVTMTGLAGWVHRHDSLIIRSAPLAAGDQRICTVVYHGTPRDGLIISRNMYGEKTFFGDNWPNRAHNWFPCVDHPSDKALSEFRITAPSHDQVVANGILTGHTSLPGGLDYTEWSSSVPIATKVMVTGIAPFAVMNYDEAGNIPVSAWVYPQNRTAGFFDFGASPEILSWLTAEIGPYPFAKLANVQSTTRYGGMENAGTIFYPERSVTGRRTNLLTMVHETAHMWFGNSAGEMDWPDLWLSEGFATYLTDLYVQDRDGDEAFRNRMSTERDEVIRFAAIHEGAVVDTVTRNIEELLNANTYEKGAWVLHMLRHMLGNELFLRGLRTYYERFTYGNATTEDFRKVMEEVSGLDFREFFTQWLYRPGIPLLHFSMDQHRSRAHITIEQTQGSVFFFPVDLEFFFEDGTHQTFTVNVDRRSQLFRFTFKNPPVKVIPDPEVRLLFGLKE